MPSGDPHWSFAEMAGLAPKGSTRHDYPELRARCKTTNLGVLYGMTEHGLALRLGIVPVEAREMLQLHRQTFRRFWQWSDQVVFTGMLKNELYSIFGWRLQITSETNPRTLMNYPMQANGAEMMRVAAIAATEAGLLVAAPVHDAFLLLAPVVRLDQDIAALREFMRKAGLAITGGLEVRTDATLVVREDCTVDFRHWGGRLQLGCYVDERGVSMWNLIMRLLGEIERVV